MRKLPIGTRVVVRDSSTGESGAGVVVRHGRDIHGIYTEVRYHGTGRTERWHRSSVRPEAEVPEEDR